MPRIRQFVIYHAKCSDGFGAAWSAYQVYSDSIKYYAGIYGKPPPNVENMDVFLLDFCYPKDVMLALINQANSVTILDHHLIAQQTIQELLDKDLLQGKFDMDKSGAMLAWEYFNPDKSAPKLIKHIQDYDLWKFKLKGTKEIISALNSYPQDFELWNSLKISNLRKEGIPLLREHNRQADELSRDYTVLKIGGYDILTVNCPHIFANTVANGLAKGKSFAATWCHTRNGIEFSLRSGKKGANVGEIATLYGGGGHKHSAGFTIENFDQEPLRSLFVKQRSKPKQKSRQRRKVATVTTEKGTITTPVIESEPINIKRKPGEPIPSQRTILRQHETNIEIKRTTVKSSKKI